MTSVCLVVMCGLPASGKSTLCRNLSCQTEKELPCRFVVVEYDELLPATVEKSLIENRDDRQQGTEKASAWKLFRQDIYMCVDWMISSLLSSDRGSETTDTWNRDCMVTNKAVFTKFVEIYKRNCQQDSLGEGVPVCVVIDDNMYYRSMRYSYFQLARKYNIGYGQIYCQTDINRALRNNQQRQENKVQDDTITQMAGRLEEPQPFKNPWEVNTLTLNNMIDMNDTLRRYICHIINQALSNPVESLPDEDQKTVEESRIICSESFVHQSDNILRKLVSQEMGIAKDSGMTKADMRNLAAELQQARKKIISDLKDGQILVPERLVAMATNASKDESNELYEYLTDLFVKRKI